ncbi:1-aminocyclopropane-1-carboxylate deaminase/D-cysteine desulfhydrase [Oceanobacillus oncorhynchi]|uniref:1-aminocyclopropane-1-carboxylate deaminase/D-cysteine desulfhydrase n=1 Tax=Oceanobacillus oncorhynchi TaxID=545501 RepID=UPI0025A4BB0D|nr:D-cysteine desulfhydrase family protein [Oceanobacillus oncorhynchi]MDM8101195.1 D-cysteine desulfhydrase family protein [Oceanobacillus oncorhynchi]
MKKINLAKTPTPIQFYNSFESNNIYIKRDDLTDLALGGNKVRKLEYFLADAEEKKADCIVTYGSPQSNHCRLTAAAASRQGVKTVLILSKSDKPEFNGNYFLFDLFDVEVVWVDTDNVPQKIEETLLDLKNKGYNPYFIQGGGHGNLGTHAYKVAFDEIIEQQSKKDIEFDYIFHASGTGTTQAGLIAGKTIVNSKIKIVGISVARNSNRGKEVIHESLKEYFNEFHYSIDSFNDQIIFNDSYIGDGYAHIYPEIIDNIKTVAKKSGVLLDPVYTGKAFYGMLSYIDLNKIKDSNVLFIHTGGTPLLFNYANMFKEE